MQASTQDKSEDSITYNPDAVLAFCQLYGKSEAAKADDTIFAQGQKTGFLSLNAEKMYFLVAGKVRIQTATGTIASIAPGETFGEFTPHPSHSVTAIAEQPCTLMTLTEKQLLAGLKNQPAFVMMLMDVLVRNLRKASSEVFSLPDQNEHHKKDRTLTAKMMQELVKKLGDSAVMDVPRQRVIFQAGGSAMLMYVILDGYMVTLFGDQIVRRSGPGDVIGEIALIDQKKRTANVITETHCSLLAINHQTLLELVKTLPTFGIVLLRVLASRLCLNSTDIPPAVKSNSLDDWDW